MFGKHHTEDTKKRISEKLKGREFTEEHKQKIGEALKGRVYGEETLKRMSKVRQKTRRILNILTGEIWIMSIQDFIEQFPEKECKYDAMKKAANKGYLYKKTYKIDDYVALGDPSEKSGENGEPPAKENPVGSNGSE